MSADDMDKGDGLGASRFVNVELPNGSSMPGEGQAIIASWVDYSHMVVTIYPEEVEKIEAAIRMLGQRAQEQYSELSSGDRVALHLSLTEGLLDSLNFDIADRYVGITGAAILVCQDGPIVGADLLAEQVGYLKRRVWREGGDDADDGDS